MKFIILTLLFVSSIVANSPEQREIARKMLNELKTEIVNRNVEALKELLSEDLRLEGCDGTADRARFLQHLTTTTIPSGSDFVVDSADEDANGKMTIKATYASKTKKTFEAKKIGDKYALTLMRVDNCGQKN